MFSGTQEKCATCGKTAYPLEKVGFKNLKQKYLMIVNIHDEIAKYFVTNWAYGCSSVRSLISSRINYLM